MREDQRVNTGRAGRPFWADVETMLFFQRTVGNQELLRLVRHNLAGKLDSDNTGWNLPDTGAGPLPAKRPAKSPWSPKILSCGAEAAMPGPAEAAPVAILIVEDGSGPLLPGQMRKSEFLLQLRRAVSASAADATAGTMWSNMDCPYIDRWFEHYAGQDSRRVERAVRQYAPEARTAASARDYILIVSARVGRSISKWSTLGT